jgi:hypothetical protein
MRHHVETKRVTGLNPGHGSVRIKETEQPLEAYLDAKSAEGWEVVSVSAIGHLEVLITYRRP